MPVPSVIFPVANSVVNIGKEAVAFGTPAASYVSMPVAGFDPDDKLTPLMDEALRGSMGKTYGMQFGPAWAEHTIPESPLFMDVIGHVLLNICGDYSATGTAGTPTWTTSGALTPGAGPVAVTLGSAAVAGTFVQVDTGVNAEVVKVGSASTTTSIVLDATTPLRMSHLSGVTVTTVTAPFTHTFSQLNPGSTTGVTDGQPPSHTLVHRTFIPGTGNFSAVQYAYACFSEVKISAKASGWFAWDGKATSYKHAYPASAPSVSFSAAKPQPAWRSTVTVAGTPRSEIAEWHVDIKRVVEPDPTADGVQDPYVFARGPLTAEFGLEYDPVIDESALTTYLNNTQPTLAWTISNGLSGASLLAMTISGQVGGYKGAPLKAQKALFGYSVTGELIENSSNSGNSGGFSPFSIALQNAVATF